MSKATDTQDPSAKAASRLAVVTGAASGIGAAISRALARHGHPVAMFDIQAELLKQTAQALREEGCRVSNYVVDVAQRSQVDEAMTAVRAEHGPIAIAVTSAGVDAHDPFLSMSLESWNRVLAINLTGAFNCIQAALPDMVAAGWGRVVTISSQSAQSGAPDRAHYVASKGGLIALTKALSFDFAPRGITANTIPPSIIDTPMVKRATEAGTFPGIELIASMTPVRRAGTPEDVAAACLFLCGDEAGFITGQQIGVNGGWYM
jgi:2-hydroxycyclohexanecarboxyl-CoA dehydrogenase